MRAVRLVSFVPIACLSVVAPADAGTLTFTGTSYTYPFPWRWTEDGITAFGAIGGFPGTVHVDARRIDYYGKSVDIVLESALLFDPQSIDISGQVSFTSQCTGVLGTRTWNCVSEPIVLEPIPYVGLYGFREGDLVAELVLYIPPGSPTTLSLQAFPSIDRLRVEALTFVDLGLQGACVQEWCAHFNFDNVVLQPVPEPGAGLLFDVGLAIAALAGCRQR